MASTISPHPTPRIIVPKTRFQTHVWCRVLMATATRQLCTSVALTECGMATFLVPVSMTWVDIPGETPYYVYLWILPSCLCLSSLPAIDCGPIAPLLDTNATAACNGSLYDADPNYRGYCVARYRHPLSKLLLSRCITVPIYFILSFLPYTFCIHRVFARDAIPTTSCNPGYILSKSGVPHQYLENNGVLYTCSADGWSGYSGVSHPYCHRTWAG